MIDTLDLLFSLALWNDGTLRLKLSATKAANLFCQFITARLMHSADYAVARCLSVCPFVCPSVRPSVTRRYSVETAKRIIKLFLPSGSHTTLVFPNQTIPVCNDTIIVLKITPLHSVSVITNFVISKRDKQKKQTRNQYASPPRGNAIPTGPLSDSDEILCR